MLQRPLNLIILGLALLLLGVALPFLMVLELMRSTFLLNFIAYASSTTGLVLGFIGLVLHVRPHRRSGHDDTSP